MITKKFAAHEAISIGHIGRICHIGGEGRLSQFVICHLSFAMRGAPA
jgi:hypothetical protein